MNVNENENISKNDNDSQPKEERKRDDSAVNDGTFQNKNEPKKPKNSFENLSEYSIIGFVFLMMGISMTIAMDSVAFSAFIVLGITFIAIGFDEDNKKSKQAENQDSGDLNKE